MRILSNTSAVPTNTVREIIQFVRPPGVSGTTFRVTQSKHARSGYAYWSRNHVSLRVGGAHHFPRPPMAGGDGYLPDPYFADQVEALVYLAAHELRHLWQARVPSGRRVWGARGQFPERDACAYGIKMLRAWRRRAVTSPEPEPSVVIPIKPAKPPVDPRAVKLARTLASIKRWEAKERRAKNALKKLRRRQSYYERLGVAACQ